MAETFCLLGSIREGRLEDEVTTPKNQFWGKYKICIEKKSREVIHENLEKWSIGINSITYGRRFV
jgi:hypothetical protein